MRDALARARTATSLPAETPGPDRPRPPLADRPSPRSPPASSASSSPASPSIGAGYALIVSLAWHTREAAVLAIEQRDGVKFYVVPNSALQPIELVRTPGPAQRPPQPRLSSFLNSRQPRVLATSAAVSQARRAVATA